MKHLLASYLKKIYPIDEPVLEDYLSHWEYVAFKRKELITREGQTERYLYFVLDGIQRSFYIKDGKEYVITFTYHPSFSGIPESFLTQSPSRYFLECIISSKFFKISYEDQQKMMIKHREIETLSRKASEILLVGFLERHYELLSFSIEERFRAFSSRSPYLLNMIPHKYLASYLRIDPTNFSKLYNGHQI